MTNSVNFSFRSQSENVTVSIARKNSVLDFKSFMVKADDGEFSPVGEMGSSNHQTSQQVEAKARAEAMQQLLSSSSGAGDYLASKGIFNLGGFPPGTSVIAAAGLVFDAEQRGETYELIQQAKPTVSRAAWQPTSVASTLMSASLDKKNKEAAETLAKGYGLYDLSAFPPGTSTIKALNYIKTGYNDVAKSELAQTHQVTPLEVIPRFVKDYPALGQLFTDPEAQDAFGTFTTKDKEGNDVVNIKDPAIRALQLVKEEDAAKAILKNEFNYELGPNDDGKTALTVLREKRGLEPLVPKEEAAALEDLVKKLGTEANVQQVLSQFPKGTTGLQLLNHWKLKGQDFDSPESRVPPPPPPGTNMNTWLNRLAADALVVAGFTNLDDFPEKITTLEAWTLVDQKKGPTKRDPQSTPAVDLSMGPVVEGKAGILKIRKDFRSPLGANPVAPLRPSTPAPVLLKGFAVVDQLVSWGAQLADPSQLAAISRDGITPANLQKLLARPGAQT